MSEASSGRYSAFGKRPVQLTIVSAIFGGLVGIEYSRWGAPSTTRLQGLETHSAPVDFSGSRTLDSSRHKERSPWLLEVDLNSADVMELALLPGVGSVLARRIVEERRVRGHFESVEDLLRVRGIGPVKLAAIRGMGVVNP